MSQNSRWENQGMQDVKSAGDSDPPPPTGRRPCMQVTPNREPETVVAKRQHDRVCQYAVN